MNFRKLITYLTMGTAAAMPLAVAQNPTILQGSYISNVFGNSNFVLNPNAQTNVANVAVSNATVTRSTTTPLVATSEFLVTTSTATGSATWSTRTFDSGMKGQNCEARFSYRGFSVGSTTAQILQGANVVAQLTLTPSTDPRIASINFPCGDLSSATTFRLQQATASLTGTNKIGGIYVGLATNMANVAQAEVVVQAGRNTTQSIGTAATTIIWNTESLDTYGEFDTSTGIFTAKRAGRYEINAAAMFDSVSFATDYRIDFIIRKNNAAVSNQLEQQQVTSTRFWRIQNTVIVDLAVGDDIRVTAGVTSGTRNLFGDTGGEYNRLSIKRFPSSSELVVTPERQGNWYVNAYHDGANIALSTATVSSKTEMTNASLTLKPVANSQPVATLCASGNNPPAVSTGNTTCSAGNESLGITFNIPSVGGYEVCATFSQNTKVPQNGYTDATFSVEETSTSSSTNLTDNPTVATFTQISSISDLGISNPVKACSNFNFTSLGQKAVRLLYRQNVSGTVTTNQILADATLGRGVIWSVVPLSTQSNSALYVQGPVLGAQTGAAIPEGYVNEFATRSITSTSNVIQSSPVAGTWYSPWTGTLTLPAGNWTICYRVLIESIQTGATAYHGIWSRILNDTDTTSVLENVFVPTGGGTISNMVNTHSGCQNVAITSSKTFKVQAKWQNWSASPTVTSIAFRGDQSKSELYALRLN